MNRGGMTLPAEVGQEPTVRALAERWGADYIRDSHGTQLSPEMLELGYGIYSTICLVRAEQAWPRLRIDSCCEMIGCLVSSTLQSWVTERAGCCDRRSTIWKRRG